VPRHGARIFRGEEVARLLNENFVAIKVDREERPEIDAIYMKATQLLTGRGGWPNSVWLTPDGRPWYAGTYFPREDRGGQPGFKTILRALAETWHSRRDDVERQADMIAEVIRKSYSQEYPVDDRPEISRALADGLIEALRATFDERFGGFGGAPKFPPHGSLRLILERHRRAQDKSALRMATGTLDAMARGGVRDHLGGGFHRYSTDARWFLPHFEKMLYDNALLSRTYVDAYVLTGDQEYRRVAVDILEWVLREMTSPEGGFYSAVDADSEGEEGKFYLWRRQEILDTLGPDEGKLFCRVYEVDRPGNFVDQATGQRPGTNILFLPRSVEETAEKEALEPAELRARLKRGRAKLLAVRSRRIRPQVDDKVLTSWNGLMIASLSYAGRRLDEPRYTAAAEKAAAFILSRMTKEGRLLHSFRAGEGRLRGGLDDYAFLADGLLDLHLATGDRQWMEKAENLADVLLSDFRDGASGFFLTAEGGRKLLVRPREPFDGAVPSGNGIAARVFVRLWRLTRDERYFQVARETIETFSGVMSQAPWGTGSLILAAELYLDERAAQEEMRVATEPADEPDVQVRKKPVTAEGFISRLSVSPGGKLHVAVHLAFDQGWHINSNRPLQGYLIPTELGLQPNPVVELYEVRYPGGGKVKLGFSDQPLSAYEGEAWITASVAAKDDAVAGEARVGLELHFQACNDRSCLAPETLALIFDLTVDPEAVPGKTRHADLFNSLGLDVAASPSNP